MFLIPNWWPAHTFDCSIDWDRWPQQMATDVACRGCVYLSFFFVSVSSCCYMHIYSKLNATVMGDREACNTSWRACICTTPQYARAHTQLDNTVMCVFVCVCVRMRCVSLCETHTARRANFALYSKKTVSSLLYRWSLFGFLNLCYFTALYDSVAQSASNSIHHKYTALHHIIGFLYSQKMFLIVVKHGFFCYCYCCCNVHYSLWVFFFVFFFYGYFYRALLHRFCKKKCIQD